MKKLAKMLQLELPLETLADKVTAMEEGYLLRRINLPSADWFYTLRDLDAFKKGVV